MLREVSESWNSYPANSGPGKIITVKEKPFTVIEQSILNKT
jgi:hypothetical protein